MQEVKVVIIGAGFSGLLAALKLLERGVRSIAVLEKDSQPGGTWHANTYPGCCCDVQSFQYLPLQYVPGFVPSRLFASQKEILAFVNALVREHGLETVIQYNTQVVSAKMNNKMWTVETQNGKSFLTKYVIFANGPLSRPAKACIPGVDSFTGSFWHSAEWNHDYDLKDKVVGVVGTGASAIQIIPQVAKQAKKLIVFQRTPAYCFPRNDAPLKPELANGLKTKGKPFIEKLRGEFNAYADTTVYRIYNIPSLNKKAQAWHKQHVLGIVQDPQLAKHLIPDYPQGCRRALLTDDYLPTFNRSNVALVPSAVTKIEQDVVFTAKHGTFDGFDAIILATGFYTGFIDDVDIIGEGGVSLKESYRDGVHSMFGLMSSGFPNLFMMLGPQSWTPQGNTSEAIDVQSNWIVHTITEMEKQQLDSISPIPAAETFWKTLCDEKGRNSVWSQCQSWYVGSDGKPFMWTGRWWEYVDELLCRSSSSFRFSKGGEPTDAVSVFQSFNVSESQLPYKERSVINVSFL